MSVAPGASAASASTTGGSGSHVTRTRAQPSSARARDSATTATTGSPCHTALSTASGYCGRRLHPGVVLQHAHPRLAARGQLAAGHDRDHAGQRGAPPRCRWPTMRAWAWGDRTKAACRRRGTAHVVGVRAPARDEPRRLGPHHRAADVCRPVRPERRRHDRPRAAGADGAPPRAGRPGRWRDSRCSGSSCRRGPRGWPPGRDGVCARAARAPSAACPACRSRTAARSPRGRRAAGRRSTPLSARPSIVSTRQPSAWAASIRQPRTG